jgi:hypothetical protein
MSRRVPEFALVTGGFLALTVLGVGVAFTGDLVRSALTAVVVGYPFGLYAVSHSEDPTEVLPPRFVLPAAAVAGATLLVAGPLAGDAVIGAADALLVFLAGVGYADVHEVGATRRTRRLLVVAGGVFSLALVGLGLVVASTTTLLPWVVAAITAALGPSLHYALSVEQGRRTNEGQNFFNRRS